MTEQHLGLLIDFKDGKPRREPVHVRPLGSGRFLLLQTPGFVYGVAAGDEIELLSSDGAFQVLKHGGNVAVRVLSSEPIKDTGDQLAAQVQQRLNGVLDGRIERGLAFSIPFSVGFHAIEAIFEAFTASHPGAVWEYGNVYDEDNQPLDWWHDAG